jgi:hypothetical protein
MVQEALSDEALVKRTLAYVGAMLGAAIVFVGGLSLVASVIVGHVVGSPSSSSSSADTSSSSDSPVAATLHESHGDSHPATPALPTPAAARLPKHRLTTPHTSESL